MNILPYKKLIIKTSKTKEEILRTMLSGKPYWGYSTLHGFKVTPVIYWGHNIKPVIIGKITEHVDETVVNIKIRPILFVSISMHIFLVGFVICLINTIITVKDLEFVIGFLFLYGFMYLVFRLVARNTEKRLVLLLEENANNESAKTNRPYKQSSKR